MIQFISDETVEAECKRMLPDFLHGWLSVLMGGVKGSCTLKFSW